MTTLEYTQVFEQYRMFVFYFCKKKLDHQEDAEDIAATTFLKLWEGIEAVTKDKAKAFLLVTANRLCLDRIKTNRKGREREFEFSLIDLEHVEIEDHVITCLHKMIESLPKQQKEAIRLRYLNGKSQSEVGDIMSVSRQTAANTISNALRLLRHKLKNPSP